MRYYDTEYTPKTNMCYEEGVSLAKERIGVTAFLDTDIRVKPWFIKPPKDCKLNYDKDGFPIFVKYNLTVNGCFYLFYTNEKDESGAFLPDIEKIEKERIKNEKINQEMMVKRKLEIIAIPSSSSFQLKTFGSLENYLCPICRCYEKRANDFPFHNDYFTDIYNFSNNINCNRCGSNSLFNVQSNYLKKLIEVIKEDHTNNIYLLLGAKEISALFNMKPNQMNDIYFDELGIPSNAKILDINLSSNCNLALFNIIPNNTRFTNTIVYNNILSFWTNKIFDEEQINIEENRLSATIKWLDIDMNNLWDVNLLNTINSFIDNNQNELILNANRTLELLCTQICYKEFSSNDTNYRHLNRKKREWIRKIKNAEYVAYSTILNNLINEIFKINNITKIDESIITKMNSLNKDLRHEIAHKGQLERELNEDKKIEILAISILGSSLLKYIYNSLK
ncbi:MAG: hypothetical protein MJK08_08730 [Campylobacterales bacterium]|nr:hypothetical protein [Campylobacterales bacterium]